LQEQLKKIDSLRKKIDQVDLKLVKLLNERAAYADEIGIIKRALKKPVYVPEREEQVIRNIQAENPGPLSAAAVKRLYERIIDESRRLEQENYKSRTQEKREV
jgi:chorismate mutase